MKYTSKQIVNFVCSLLLSILPFIVFFFPFLGQMKGYQIFELIKLAEMLGQLNVILVLLCEAMVLVLVTSAILLVVTIGNIISNKIKIFSDVSHDIIVHINLVAILLVAASYLTVYIKFNFFFDEFIPIGLLVMMCSSVLLSALSILSKNLWWYVLVIFLLQWQAGIVVLIYLIVVAAKKDKKANDAEPSIEDAVFK